MTRCAEDSFARVGRRAGCVSATTTTTTTTLVLTLSIVSDFTLCRVQSGLKGSAYYVLKQQPGVLVMQPPSDTGRQALIATWKSSVDTKDVVAVMT